MNNQASLSSRIVFENALFSKMADKPFLKYQVQEGFLGHIPTSFWFEINLYDKPEASARLNSFRDFFVILLTFFRKSLENACREAKIPYGRYVQGGFIFHDLRHTFTTIARRAGVPRNVVMTITGHTANDMNFRYDTVDENDLPKAVDQIEAYLESVDQNVGQVELEN